MPEFCFDDLGACIGRGVDGSVWELTSDPDKVVKLTGRINPLILFSIKETAYPHFARVFEYGDLLPEDWKPSDIKLETYIVMERLLPLTEDEAKVFHSTHSHEDRKIEKHLSNNELVRTLNLLARGLEFDAEKVIAFNQCLLTYKGIKHTDIHERNLMKDKRGNFKLVDFNRLQLIGSPKGERQ